MRVIWKMLLLSGIALFLVVSGAWAEDYPEMKLRYANYIPEKAPNSKVDIFVANELTKRTNGRVQVTIYHGGTTATTLDSDASPDQHITLESDGTDKWCIVSSNPVPSGWGV